MHILMVAPQPFFRPRGTPFSVLHRIRALLRLGHQVDLLTYPFGDSPDLPGLVIQRAARPPWVRDVAIGPSLSKIFLDIPLFLAAYERATTGEYDLVHTHEEAGTLGAWIARRTGLPHLYDMHSSLPLQFANFGRFNWRPITATFERLERFTLSGSDGVIAICPELRDRAAACGYQGPLAMIENTMDFDVPDIGEADVRELRQALGLDSEAVVLYTGTLEPYQGLDLLVAAAPEVVHAVPAIRFVIVGGSQEQIEALQRSTKQHEVQSSFTFVPAVPPSEVFRYHRLADVLVTTRSRGTNTPLKIYQYLRAGRPIVATDIRSHTQVLSPETAQLVSPTPADIAKGLVAVLSDRSRAGRLAGAAARLAETEYSQEAYMSRLEELLDQMPIGPHQRAA